MKDVRDSENLEAMRRKLYARSSAANAIEQHGLTDEPVDVSRNWDLPQPETVTEDLRTAVVATATEAAPEPPPTAPSSPRRRYRMIILLASLLIFIFGVGFSSLYLYLGGNQISSDQIGIQIEGPLTVGGGEVMELKVLVSNDNDVAIESVTLVMKYPEGTRSVGEAPRVLFEERIPIRALGPGESRVVPVQVAVFGEEQTTASITATLEYRITGSNGTFYKEGEPLAFAISSAPVVLRVDSVEKVSSGQTVDVTLTLVSNASSPLSDILVTATYPNGFRYESAEPAPVFGKNVWRVSELQPEASQTITITGVAVGLSEAAMRLNFAAGPAQLDNPYLVSSTLTETNLDLQLERPFIDVITRINNQEQTPVILPEDQSSRVTVEVTNTLPDTVYDMYVEVLPGGNALTESSIKSQAGFYDSNTGSVRWEVSNNPSFAVVRPGDERKLEFTVEPAAPRATAAYDLVINVYARRVAEPSAAEQLIGTTEVAAKYSSSILVGSQADRSAAPFSNLGPLPPRVGEQTTYTLTMVAEAGVNDLTDAVVRTSLPVYVTWLDQFAGDGELVYNAVSKQLEWNVGNMLARDRKQMQLQVAITPSISQVETTPILLQQQVLRATDRFSEERLQVQAEPVYTELSTEAGHPRDNGVVQR